LQNLQNNIQSWESNIEQKIVNGAKSLVNFFVPGYYESKSLADKVKALEQTQDQLERIKQILEEKGQTKIEIISGKELTPEQPVPEQKNIVEQKVIKQEKIIEKVIEERVVEKQVIPAGELAQIQADLVEIRGLATRNIVEEHKIYYGGIASPYDAAIGRDFSVGGSTTFGSANKSTDLLAVYSEATFNDPITANSSLTVAGNTTLDTVTISDLLTVNATSTFAGSILPYSDDAYNLGSSTAEWHDLYIDGTAYLDGISSLGIIGETDNDLTITAPEGKHVIINNLQTPYHNTITVAKSGADYSTITEALNAITDASSSNRYLIRLMPGTYSEPITLKEYIDIVGQDAKSVVIEQSAATVLTTADNARFENITLNKTTDNNNPIISVGTTSPGLFNMILIGAGTANQAGVSVTTGSPDIKYIDISGVKYGLIHSGSTGLSKVAYSTFNSGTYDIYATGSVETATTVVQSYFNHFTGSNSIHIEITDSDMLVGGVYLNSTGDLFPGRANAYDLGSAAVDWDKIYANELHVDTIYGQVDIAGTTADLFTINSGATASESSQLRFHRGEAPSPNRHAILSWDESNGRFDFNFPLHFSQTGTISSASDLSITPTGDLSLTPAGGDLAINANTSVVGPLSVTYTSTGGNILQLVDGSNTVFSVADGGNVGIGDTSPAALLTVGNGDLFQVSSTGDLTLTGTADTITGPSGGLTITGGTAASDNLTLVSTTNATKGNIYFHTTSYYLNSTGDLVLGGRMTFENAEYVSNEANGYLLFQGSGGATGNRGITFNLDGTHPVITSDTNTLQIDDDVQLVGPQTISTSTGDLTLDAGSNLVISDATVQFNNTTQVFDIYSASGATTLQIKNSDATQVANLDLVDGSLYTNGTQRIDNSGNLVNIGTIASGAITITSTSTPQLTAKYDANNYLTISVSNAGLITFDAVGTSPNFAFSDNVSLGANSLTGTTTTIDFSNFDVASTGHITVQPAYGLDVNSAGELKLGDTTATTISLGTTAGTTFNIGAGGALTRAINIGTGTGADTINIGTGTTTADILTFGNTGVGTTFTFNSGATSGNILTVNDEAGDTTPFVIDNAGNVGIGDTTPDAQLDLDVSATTGTILAASYPSAKTQTGAITGLDLDFSNLTTDGTNTFYGLHLNDQVGSTASTEYGLYIEGTNWDYGIYSADDVKIEGQCVTGDTILPIISEENSKLKAQSSKLQLKA